MDLLRPLAIGDVVLENNLLLSPMAGYTDVAFRVLCRRHGAGSTSTEQVGAGGFGQGAAKSLLRAAIDGRERPVMLQLITADPAEAASAASRLPASADLVGLNMGCPAHQVQRAGCGAALLDHPDRAEALVRAVKGATGRPLVVKIRLGNRRRVDAPAFARRMVDAGADALIVHGRAACDGYAGTADRAAIRAVVEAVDAPVVANGDVVDGASAAAMLRDTGAAGVAIGRASLGDPRIFRRVATYLATGREPARAFDGQLDDLVEYLRLAEAAGLPAAHVLKQAQRFTKGIPGAGRVRAALGRGTPVEALRDVLAARLSAERALPA